MTREEYMLKPFKDNAGLIAERFEGRHRKTAARASATIALKDESGAPVREATVRAHPEDARFQIRREHIHAG